MSPEKTKAKRAAVIYLPPDVTKELEAANRGKEPQGKLLEALSTDYHHNFLRDLEKAGITRQTFKGRACLHSLRVTFVTLAGETGSDPQTMQRLARHATADLTLRLYAKAREDHVREAALRIGKAVSKAESDARNVHTGVTRPQFAQAAGGEHDPNYHAGKGVTKILKKYPHGDSNPGLQAENLTS